MTTLPKPPQRRYRTLDLDSYIKSVEDAVRSLCSSSSSPADGKIYMHATEPHRRIMIRTLLSIPTRTEFDRLLRDSRNEYEFRRWKEFVSVELEPALAAEGSAAEAELVRKNPKFRAELEGALVYDWTNGNVSRRFSRMASCAAYRGDMGALLRDIAPSTVERYEGLIAECGPSDEEALAALIEGSEDVEEGRKDVAWKCLKMDLSAWSGPDDDGDNGRTAGEGCERECAKFLREDLAKDLHSGALLMLDNVLVKKVRKGKTLANVSIRDGEPSSKPSGVILTSLDRDGITSEFDAVVVDTVEDCVAQIWESKETIGPGTIMDVATKKLPAVLALLDEEDTVLLYRDSFLYREGGTASISRALNGRPFQFGIFGREVQSPQKAAAQLRTIACQELLSRDVDAVIKAVETGRVELDIADVIERLERLRSGFKDGEDFTIRVVVAN